VRKARSYIRQASIPLPDRLESYNFLHREPLAEIFEPEFLAAVDTERPLAMMREAYFRTASAASVDRMMHLDHKITLADNDLRKVSRMCEAAGVEARFPFLDPDLIDFAGTLSVPQKVSGNRLRVFFKDALRDFLPGETIAKSKHGFGLPFGLWLAQDGPLRSPAATALDSLARRGIVRADYARKLWREHSSGHASYFGVMIWVLIQLELWLQRNDRSAEA
jgi:asparagine synthase (glutamine-hydrolysing)